MKGLRLKIRLSCIICTFLCGVFSAEAQSPQERALALERTVWQADGPEEASAALQAKAACYAEAGMPEEALATLERIKLYLLDEPQRRDVLRSKAAYALAAGQETTALSLLEESGTADENPVLYAVLLASAGRYDEARTAALRTPGADAAAIEKLFRKVPKDKSETTAMWLSLVPGLGQCYLGKPGAGLVSVGLTGASAAFLVWQCMDGCWITGLLGGGLLLKEFYFDRNIIRTVESVDTVNRERREAFARQLQTLLEP